MFFSNLPSLTCGLLFGVAAASPLLSDVLSDGLSDGNITHSLELRATPTTPITAAGLASLHLYSQYAAAAYCNSKVNKVGSKITCGSNACPMVQALSVTNYAYLGFDQSQANGFVGIDSTTKQIIVAYAGSSNFDNYIADILFESDRCEGALERVSGCKLHKGFQYAWMDVQQSTMKAVQAAVKANPSYQVIAVGHSLGGAVATIAAAYLRAAGIPTNIVSFGSPRVGNKAFVEFVNAQAGTNYRVTHYNDPFTRYPGKFFGYRHTSPEIWLSTGNAEQVSYSLDQIKVCVGIDNTSCNDGTSSLDTTAHKYYFQRVSACR